MHSHSPEETPCPVCGQPYDQRVVVERGDQWADAFGRTPLALMKEYPRRCASPQDVERETQRGEAERVVYFHDERNQAGRR